MHTHSAPDMTPHFEVEFKIPIGGKKESRAVRQALKRLGFVLQDKALIVDFVEPKKTVTSRIRLKKSTLANPEADVVCYMGKKSHPIEGELEEFVRQEQDPAISAEMAIDLLMRAIQHHENAPIPYYSKMRRFYTGELAGFAASVALDNPRGLLKKYTQRYLEVEIQLPLSSPEEEIAVVVEKIRQFVFALVGEAREPQISYRRMVLNTWKARGALVS